MAEREFLHLNELEDIMNDPNLMNMIDFDDDDDNIDIIQLPPEKVDEVSDQEEIYEKILEDSLPRDVTGKVELHCSFFDKKESVNDSEEIPAKNIRLSEPPESCLFGKPLQVH